MTTLKKLCYLCDQSTDAEGTDLIYFGEWMTKSDITVHYFCLLLSTGLEQRGPSNAGILGFYLRDIRKEAQMAKSQKCKYCGKAHATIMCNSCKKYFHLTCGLTSQALSQYHDKFLSYCDECIPHDDVWEKLKIENPPIQKYNCHICSNLMGSWKTSRWIYAKCCGKGFVHSLCMKTYALKAGYYLRCLWCKDKRFRDDVKGMGVFVPDREAEWELEKGAFQDFYRGHQRCDMEKCHCPHGRDYINGRKWTMIICQLCGSFGAHNPICLPGMNSKNVKVKEFICDACSETGRTINSQSSLDESARTKDTIETVSSMWIQKVNNDSDLHQQNNNDVGDSNLFQIPTSVDSTCTAAHISTQIQCEESNKKQPQPIVEQLHCTAELTSKDIKDIAMVVDKLFDLFEP